jgi:hypothetical protein
MIWVKSVWISYQIVIVFIPRYINMRPSLIKKYVNACIISSYIIKFKQKLIL